MKDLINGIPIDFTYRTIVKLWENPTLHGSYCYSKFLNIFMISKQIQNMQLGQNWVLPFSTKLSKKCLLSKTIMGYTFVLKLNI